MRVQNRDGPTVTDHDLMMIRLSQARTGNLSLSGTAAGPLRVWASDSVTSHSDYEPGAAARGTLGGHCIMMMMVTAAVGGGNTVTETWSIWKPDP